MKAVYLSEDFNRMGRLVICFIFIILKRDFHTIAIRYLLMLNASVAMLSIPL